MKDKTRVTAIVRFAIDGDRFTLDVVVKQKNTLV